MLNCCAAYHLPELNNHQMAYGKQTITRYLSDAYQPMINESLRRHFFVNENLTMRYLIVLALWLVGKQPAIDPLPYVADGTAVPLRPTITPEEISLGKDVYVQNCASCHGVNLEGESIGNPRMKMACLVRHHMTQVVTPGTKATHPAGSNLCWQRWFIRHECWWYK